MVQEANIKRAQAEKALAESEMKVKACQTKIISSLIQCRTIWCSIASILYYTKLLASKHLLVVKFGAIFSNFLQTLIFLQPTPSLPRHVAWHLFIRNFPHQMSAAPAQLAFYSNSNYSPFPVISFINKIRSRKFNFKDAVTHASFNTLMEISCFAF